MHYPLTDLADFVFILTFFVLPALFSPVSGNVTVPDAENIPWLSVIVHAVLVAYMAVRYHNSNNRKRQHESCILRTKSGTARESTPKKISGFFAVKPAAFICNIANAAATTACLIITDYIITKLALRFSGTNALPEMNVTASTSADKFFLVSWTILLASFEEFTYRYLLPTRLLFFWPSRIPEDKYTTTRKVFCELAVIFLFALSHRYMGWWAVANAFSAGLILRSCFFITGSIYPALIAHILYNLIAFYGILTP